LVVAEQQIEPAREDEVLATLDDVPQLEESGAAAQLVTGPGNQIGSVLGVVHDDVAGRLSSLIRAILSPTPTPDAASGLQID
jgi:hypothetical protein